MCNRFLTYMVVMVVWSAPPVCTLPVHSLVFFNALLRKNT